MKPTPQLKKYMARRVERTLYALAASKALRVHHGKKGGQLYLAGPEGGPSSSVLLFDLTTGAWRDKRTDGQGSGLFAAMRRLGVSLELVTAALTADAMGDK